MNVNEQELFGDLRSLCQHAEWSRDQRFVAAHILQQAHHQDIKSYKSQWLSYLRSHTHLLAELTLHVMEGHWSYHEASIYLGVSMDDVEQLCWSVLN